MRLPALLAVVATAAAASAALDTPDITDSPPPPPPPLPPAPAPQCASATVQEGVEFTRPDHYKEVDNVVGPDHCCALCGAEPAGACGAWKYAKAKSGGRCRLLATAPTRQQKEASYVSGLAPPAPTPPAPTPAAPTPPPTPRAPGAPCDVRDPRYGAKGDGKATDTAAIAAAIADPACSTVLLPGPDHSYLTGTLFLRSNLVLRLGAGARILGKAGAIAQAESNPWDAYQDYGHSHWRDSLIVGDGVHNVTVEGAGAGAGGGSVIDGNGALHTGTPKAGQGCRLLALRNCSGVALRGFATAQGGWFTVLATGIDGLHIADVDVAASGPEEPEGVGGEAN